MARHVELVRLECVPCGPVLQGVERSSAAFVKNRERERERKEDNEFLRAPSHSLFLICDEHRVKGTEKFIGGHHSDGCCNSVRVVDRTRRSL